MDKELKELLEYVRDVLSEHVNDEDIEEGTREAEAFQQVCDYLVTHDSHN